VTTYLVDTNVLLRFVKPDDRDYPLVRSTVHQLWMAGEDLCYTSQNLAEFWNTCTRPGERNGYGLSIPQADRRTRLVESLLTFNTRDFLRYGKISLVHPQGVERTK
jgi:hypothetical protein